MLSYVMLLYSWYVLLVWHLHSLLFVSLHRIFFAVYVFGLVFTYFIHLYLDGRMAHRDSNPLAPLRSARVDEPAGNS